MTTTVFEDENVTFTYDSEQKELYQKWDGFVESEVFRKAVDKVVQLADQHSIYYIISDTTTHKTLSPEDGEYAARLMPQLFERGIRFVGFVLSQTALGRMAVERFTKISEGEINIGHFDDAKEARKWVSDNKF